MALAPLPSRGIGAADEHSNGRDRDNDERYNECHPPCDVGCKMLILYQGVEDGRHQEVGDTPSSVTETPSQGVGCSDNVLVEESC